MEALEGNMITAVEKQEFVEYVLSFYGNDGIYPMGATQQSVEDALKIYLTRLDDDYTWGGGDSLDRERIRDIMDYELDKCLHSQRVSYCSFQKLKTILNEKKS